ncbi:unnamed protein product [Absidia cylindrospora]
MSTLKNRVGPSTPPPHISLYAVDASISSLNDIHLLHLMTFLDANFANSILIITIILCPMDYFYLVVSSGSGPSSIDRF